MIYLRVNLDNKQANNYFLDYLKEGIKDIIQELYRRKSKHEKKVLAQNLEELGARYKIELSLKKYIECLTEALDYTLVNKVLILQVSPKNRYYKLIKSIELGSYKIKAVPLLGKVLAMIPNLIDRLYTDYDVVVEKLSYYKMVDSVKYRLLTRYSLYKLSNRLNNKVKLL